MSLKTLMGNFAKTISTKNRQRKYNYFLEQMQPGTETTILDVGFTEEPNPFPGVNFLENNYPYKNKLTALGVEDAPGFKEKFPEVNVVKYDGSYFPFADKEFDIVWSNAVIEHVGTRDQQFLFLSELIRTGKNVFITTPNKWFPIEVHTQLPIVHYLPKKYFNKILLITGNEWAAGDYMNLLSIGDVKKMLRKLNVKNYHIKRNKKFLLTMDFVVVIKENK